MEKTRIPYACTLLVLSAACDSEVLTTSTAQALTQTVCSGGLCYEVADPIHDDEKCPGDRYIGYTSSSSCPVAGSSWTTSHLFEGSSGELARFCLYTWPSGSAPVPGELPVIPRAKDCPVVTPLSPSLNSPLSREAVLEDAFLDQVEAFGSLQAAVDPIPVAVIDAGPAAAPPLWTEGRIAHPRALQLLIHRLACPQNGALGQLCAADPYSFLALPRYREPSGAIGYDVVDGGEFGYQSDLAIAIFEAARDLRQPQGPQAILNLSVGWHPGAAGPGTPGSFSPPVDAVYRALQYASCHEHLIFAAAGNTTGGAHVAPSAFLPGAWTTLPSPAPTDCRTLFGLRPTAPPLGIPHPLVHATAGLDSQDDMLHNAVPGARPRLLAAGSYSVVEDRVSPAAGDYTPPLTGSSISTAVLSAAAAVVWSLRPHLTAPEVAEAVYASGHPTFMATELHLGRAGLAHRVSMCGSAEDACLLRGSCSVACVRQGGKRDLRPRLPPLTASDVASA
ncbi:MAG: S8/S53 family peptidase, partial [Myxococcota bacterium]